jgi:Domain of unknown function (DUF4439)
VSTPSALDALQRTLAAEHAAIFLLAALGGRASTTQPSAPKRDQKSALLPALDAAYAAHVRRRDQLRTMIAADGAEPLASEPAYRLPGPLTSTAQIRAEALRVERACTTTYAALVAATAKEDRRWAIDALVATAVGQPTFGGRAEALPGIALA